MEQYQVNMTFVRQQQQYQQENNYNSQHNYQHQTSYHNSQQTSQVKLSSGYHSMTDIFKSMQQFFKILEDQSQQSQAHLFQPFVTCKLNQQQATEVSPLNGNIFKLSPTGSPKNTDSYLEDFNTNTNKMMFSDDINRNQQMQHQHSYPSSLHQLQLQTMTGLPTLQNVLPLVTNKSNNYPPTNLLFHSISSPVSSMTSNCSTSSSTSIPLSPMSPQLLSPYSMSPPPAQLYYINSTPTTTTTTTTIPNNTSNDILKLSQIPVKLNSNSSSFISTSLTNTNNSIPLHPLRSNSLIMSQENINQQQQQSHLIQQQQQQQQQYLNNTYSCCQPQPQQQQQQFIQTGQNNEISQMQQQQQSPMVVQLSSNQSQTTTPLPSTMAPPIINNNNNKSSPPNTQLNKIKVNLVSPSQSLTNKETITTNTNNNVNNTTTTTTATIIKTSKEKENNKDTDGDEEDEETEEELNEVVEESKDGRWSKRNESVSQRDIPGIDFAYLAMDTEYGFEVVWNEIKLSGGKKFKNENLHNDEKEIDRVFKNLINLNHSNIVKFHDYWIDKRENDPRIIFITEYMSSGSLKQFLRKAKKTNQSIKKPTWKRWCIHLLSALHYLHNCDPPVVHGDLSCDTIFIQHNGLIKIGSIAPDIVNTHVKTCIDVNKLSRHLHFIAPELKDSISNNSSPSNSDTEQQHQQQNNNNNLSLPKNQQQSHINKNKNTNTAVDIYAFGMVALEMFNLEFGGNGDTHAITNDLIKQSIEALDEKQQDFINSCIATDPKKRPTAKDLLFHPLLFEVPQLRLLSAHQLIRATHNDSQRDSNINTFNDSSFTRSADFVIATLNECSKEYKEFKFNQLPVFDVNKYLEDVKNGLYPLTAFGLNYNQNNQNNMNMKNHHYQNNNHNHHHHHQQQPQQQQDQLTNNISIQQTSTSLSSSSATVISSSSNIKSSKPSPVSSSNNSNSSSSSSSPSQSMSHQSFQQQQQQLNHINQQSDQLENSLNSEVLLTLGNPNHHNHQQQQLNIIRSNNSSSSLNNGIMNSNSRTQSPIQLNNTKLTNGAIYPSTTTNNLDLNSYNLNGDITNVSNNINDSSFSSSTSSSSSTSNNSNNNNNQIDSKSEKRTAQTIDIKVDPDMKQAEYILTVTVTFEDRTARLIKSPLSKTDTVLNLAEELIAHGLVNELDKEKLCILLNKEIDKIRRDKLGEYISEQNQTIFTTQNNML